MSYLTLAPQGHSNDRSRNLFFRASETDEPVDAVLVVTAQQGNPHYIEALVISSGHAVLGHSSVTVRVQDKATWPVGTVVNGTLRRGDAGSTVFEVGFALFDATQGGDQIHVREEEE